MIVQLLTGAGFLSVDQSNPDDQMLFSAAQKLLGMVIALVQAVAYVYSGMYGAISSFAAVMIVVQLVACSVLVMLLDEVLSEGYGITGGTTLFIATNICETVFWKSFSPSTINRGRGMCNTIWNIDLIFFQELSSKAPLLLSSISFLPVAIRFVPSRKLSTVKDSPTSPTSSPLSLSLWSLSTSK